MGDPDLATLAAGQGALVTRVQARDELSRKTLESRLATGRIAVVRRGVYRFAGAPPGQWEPIRAACLAAGPSAVASHRAAAELWAMPAVVAEGPELTVPWPRWVRLPGVRCHQTRYLPTDHRTTRNGVPVTTPARTLFDLSACIGTALLGPVTDGCLRRRIVTLDELGAAYDLLARPGRRHTNAIREVLAARQPGWCPGDSHRELDLLAVLVDAGLPRPVQQHQVAAGGTVYLLDLAYPALRIGIEYDGWDAHGTRSGLDRGAARGNALALGGWTVLHFTSASSAATIVAEVTAARQRAARARPPHQV